MQQAAQQRQNETQEETQRRPLGHRLWEWSGFGEKKGWEWLQLLIIPLVLAVGGLLFNWAQDTRQQEAEETRAKAQLAAEEQRGQDVALQSYLDQMGNLLIGEGLLASQEGDEVRTLARSRTLTTLSRVDAAHKRSVVQFLHESKLIQGDHPVVMLQEADLREADLLNVNLADANLTGANLDDADLNLATLRDTNLIGADLSEAYLRVANLIDADLRLANLSGADLSEAYLRDATFDAADLSNADLSGAQVSQEQLEVASSLEGATMPDGSTHD